MNNHGLFALKSGDQICVDKKAYTVEKLIYPGVQSYVYSCRDKHGQALCIKEHLTTDSSRSRTQNEIDKSEYNALIHDPKEKAEIAKQMQMARGFANAFKEGCPQGAFLPFAYDEELLTEVMCIAACKTIYEQVAEWETAGLSPLERVREATQIIETLLPGLGKAHEKGFLHGDLSGGNVMVAEFASVRVAFLIDLTSSIPLNGAHIPDRARSEGFAHPRCDHANKKIDLYAAGALIRYMLTGDKTDTDLSDDYNIEQLLEDLDLPFGVKMKLTEVIKRACSIDKDVFADCTQMQAQIKILQEIIERRGVHREVLAHQSFLEFEKQFESIYKGEFDKDILPETTGDILADNTLLWSDGGAGKSTILYSSWQQQLKMLEKDFSNPVPIYLSVAQFKERTELDCYIRNSILRKFLEVAATEENREQLNELFKKDACILYLDGFDEGISTDLLDTEIKELLKYPLLRICVASRSESIAWSCASALRKIQVKPLTEDMVQHKLRENGLAPVYGRLLDTLRVPMWLSMYLRLKINDAVVTPGDLLEKHHEHLLNAFADASHGKDWTSVHQTIMNKILPQFATAINRMYFTQETAKAALATVPHREEITTFLASKGKNTDKVVLDMLVGAGLLRKLDEESLAFSHQRFLEFYLAMDIYNQMSKDTADTSLPKALCEGILPDGISRFLGDLYHEHEFSAKNDCYGPPSKIEEWIQKHLIGRKDREAQLCVRNLVEVMKVARDRYVTADYTGLDLTLTNFYDCYIKGAIFENTKVTETTFVRCGHQYPIDTIAIMKASQRIISASSKENMVYFWDMTTGQIVDQIHHNDTVQTFTVSDDEQMLMVRNQGKVTIYYLDKSTPPKNLELYTCDLEKKNRNVLIDFDWKNRILCTCGKNGEDQVVLWDVSQETSEVLLDLSEGYVKEPTGQTQTAALSADRKILYVVSNHEELVIWDLRTKTHRDETFWTFAKIEGLAVSPDKKHAVLITKAKKLLRVDLDTGEIGTICDHIEQAGVAVRTFFAATNTHFIWNSKGNVCSYLFNVKRPMTLYDSLNQIDTLAVDKTGEYFIFCDEDKTIRISTVQDRRIVSSFECGMFVNWDVGHVVIPHIFEQGIARKLYGGDVQCFIDQKCSVLDIFNFYGAICFDGNYCICSEKNQDGRYDLVVRNLLNGEVARVPDSLRSVVYDQKGEKLFESRSVFLSAKYLSDKKKLVAFYENGMTQIWDFSSRNPRSKEVGKWETEVTVSLIRFGRLQTMLNMMVWPLPRYIVGKCIIQGTMLGRVQCWNLDGKKEMDADVHAPYLPHIYKIPGDKYFISEDSNQVRCIWELETYEMIYKYDSESSNINAENILGILTRNEAKMQGFSLNGNPFRDQDVGDCELAVYGEQIGDHVLLGCEEAIVGTSRGGSHDTNQKARSYCRVLSDSGHIAIYYDVPGNPEDEYSEKRYSPFIRVYNTQTGKRIQNYDLRCVRHISAENPMYAINVNLNEAQNKLAVAFADRSVAVFDWTEESPVPILFWEATDVADLSGCYFENTKMNDELIKRLQQNGAIVK